ncbi:MAG: nuclease [Mesorhizobium amorphae]|nr:MAG: nuclease [Mesorhizobium amorphae]
MTRTATRGSRAPRRLSWTDLVTALIVLAVLSTIAERFNRQETESHAGNAVIHDGDTLRIGDDRYRLVGIDAPELRQVCRLERRQYPCGERSRDELIALVNGARVSCSAEKRDRYRRLLGSCTANGIDLNRELVRSGWAVIYGKGFEAEQAEARAAKRGLWAGTFENPKEWRQRNGDASDLEFGPVREWLVRLGERLGVL